jgi:multidrug efflux pump subunit AcrA (membrane-fusion protein)/DNA-binding FrmR family transcriptional regulator
MNTTSSDHLGDAGAATCHVAGVGIPTASAHVDCAEMHRQLSAVGTASSHRELAEKLEPLVAAASVGFVALCESGQDVEMPAVIHSLFGGADDLVASQEAILRIARRMMVEGQPTLQEDLVGGVGCLLVWSLPGQTGRSLVASFTETSPSHDSLLTLQAVVVQIAAWHAARDAAAREIVAKRLAALTELLSRLETTGTLSEACRLLADELQRYLGCQQVVVGLCREGSSRCRIEAISGADAFHAESDSARLAQAALQEAIARGETSHWPAQDDSFRFGLKAHEQFASAIDAEVVIGSGLPDERGEIRAAWLFAGTAADLSRDDVLAMLDTARSPVASVLGLLARAQPSRLRRFASGLASSLRRRRGQAILAAVALAIALMFVPVPHRVKCDCQLEPVTRRFVAAPFDGPLEETFVEPGDLITAGQLLARMDGREVRWELAGVQAERYRASKERAGHVALHEAGAAEIVRHEMDRLQYREQLLKARDQDLDIRSPVDGMVVSGDLKDAEGMPLQVGEVLFEVAPLDVMIVELAVPEDDMTFVRSGMPVRITFDAFPFRPYETRIERVHPRAELREEENVFVAEVRLANPRQALHPGMRGHARVEAGNARLGWVLLRRPAAAALEWLGW